MPEHERNEFESDNSDHDLIKLTKTLAGFRAPAYDVEAELQRMLKNREAAKSAKVVSLISISSVLRIAAVLLIGLSAYFLLTRENLVRIESLAGNKKEVLLPDSSRVILNSLSVVQYSENEWAENRIIQLDGEAFFEVKKGSTFRVETSSGTVQVLGTKFNTKDRNGFYEVSCYEGKVRVQYDDKRVELTRDETFRIINGESTLTKLESASSNPTWLENESTFSSVPFSQVLEEFERQYGVEIEVVNVDVNQLFTGRFVHDNLTLGLDAISISFNLSYTLVNEKKIFLSGDIK